MLQTVSPSGAAAKATAAHVSSYDATMFIVSTTALGAAVGTLAGLIGDWPVGGLIGAGAGLVAGSGIVVGVSLA